MTCAARRSSSTHARADDEDGNVNVVARGRGVGRRSRGEGPVVLVSSRAESRGSPRSGVLEWKTRYQESKVDNIDRGIAEVSHSFVDVTL